MIWSFSMIFNAWRNSLHNLSSQLSLVVLLLLLVGCDTRSEGYVVVEQAENIMQSEPQRAVAMLASVDREELRNDRESAYYALVYSEALYYNRSLITSDSLTSVATDYYNRSNDLRMRARALYQHAQVLNLQGELPDAVISLSRAKEALDVDDDKLLRGLIERLLGDIYRASYLYHNSFAAYSAAYACFEALDLPYHSYYTLYNMGQAAERLNDYELAERLFIEARDYAIEAQNLDFLCVVLHELCEIYLQQDEYAKCRECVDMFETYDCALWLHSRYYAVRAIVTSEEGDHAEAFRLIELAESVEVCDVAIIEEAKYHLYNNIGDLQQAQYWLKALNDRLNSRLIAASEQPVLNYQVELMSLELEREAREHQVIRQRNLAIYAIIAVVAIVVCGIVYHRRRKWQQDIQHYMDTINELQLTKSNSREEPLVVAVSRLYKDRLVDLNRFCETYYEHGDTPRQTVKVFEQVRSTIEAIKSDKARIEELESLVDSCRDGLMSKLREQCPKLNERELRVALYSYAGFSSRAICVFMESNPVALSKMKYRIKVKIKESGAEDAEMLISAILDS